MINSMVAREKEGKEKGWLFSYFFPAYVLLLDFFKSTPRVELCSRPATMSQVSICQVKIFLFSSFVG